SPPISAEIIRFYYFTTPGGGGQEKPGETGCFCPAGACLFGAGGAEENPGEKSGVPENGWIEFFPFCDIIIRF
ncbi:MAG: hypothetical protein IKX47_05020, partial [Oscillospiraceae bacterium]|nr:hypothetical protein [Oscillospiraceae bacterium]